MFVVIISVVESWFGFILSVLQFLKTFFSHARSLAMMTKRLLPQMTPRGQFHQHLRANFSGAQDSMPFLANGVRQMAHKFGKFQLTSRANLAALNIGEIERQFFCQTPCASNFSLGEKVW